MRDSSFIKSDGSNIPQILDQLLADTLTDSRHGTGTAKRRRQYAGSSCADCGGTGMAGPRFCGCAAGIKLGYQAYGR